LKPQHRMDGLGRLIAVEFDGNGETDIPRIHTVPFECALDLGSRINIHSRHELAGLNGLKEVCFFESLIEALPA